MRGMYRISRNWRQAVAINTARTECRKFGFFFGCCCCCVLCSMPNHLFDRNMESRVSMYIYKYNVYRSEVCGSENRTQWIMLVLASTTCYLIILVRYRNARIPAYGGAVFCLNGKSNNCVGYTTAAAAAAFLTCTTCGRPLPPLCVCCTTLVGHGLMANSALISICLQLHSMTSGLKCQKRLSKISKVHFFVVLCLCV